MYKGTAIWDDGSLDAEFLKNYNQYDKGGYWKESEPSGKEYCFTVKQATEDNKLVQGINDEDCRSHASPLCEINNFDCQTEGDVKYSVLLYNSDNELVSENSHSNVRSLNNFALQFDSENNKHYTIKVRAENCNAVKETTLAYHFCYNIDPEIKKTEYSTAVKNGERFSINIDSISFGVNCESMHESIGVKDNDNFSDCSIALMQSQTEASLSCNFHGEADGAYELEIELSNHQNSEGSKVPAKLKISVCVIPNENKYPTVTVTPNVRNESPAPYYVTKQEVLSKITLTGEFVLADHCDANQSDKAYTHSISVINDKTGAVEFTSEVTQTAKEFSPRLRVGETYTIQLFSVKDAAVVYDPNKVSLVVRRVDSPVPFIKSPEFGSEVSGKIPVSLGNRPEPYEKVNLLVAKYGASTSVKTFSNKSPSIDLSDFPVGAYGVIVEVEVDSGVTVKSPSQHLVFKSRDGACNGQPPTITATRSPSNGEVLSDYDVYFSWENKINYCTETNSKYRLVVSTDDSFVVPVASEDNLKANHHSVRLESGTYYWKIETVRGQSQAESSEVFSFTVCGLNTGFSIASPPEGFVVSVYNSVGTIPLDWKISVPSCINKLFDGAIKMQVGFDDSSERSFDVDTSGQKDYQLTDTKARGLSVYYTVATPFERTTSEVRSVTVCNSVPPTQPKLKTSLDTNKAFVQKIGDTNGVTFSWEPSSPGNPCVQKKARDASVSYMLEVYRETALLYNKTADTESVSIKFDASGTYRVSLYANNGERLSEPLTKTVNVCVQKKPAEFEISYPFANNAKLETTSPTILYTITDPGESCDSGASVVHVLYVKKQGETDFTPHQNVYSGDGGNKNWFEQNPSPDGYCVFIRKKNGEFSVDSNTVCFTTGCSPDKTPEINVSLETYYEVSDAIKVDWSTSGLSIGEVNSCGSKPLISYAIKSSTLGYEYESPYYFESPVTITPPQSGTYTVTFYSIMQGEKITVAEKQIEIVLYSKPQQSAFIAPVDGFIASSEQDTTTVTFEAKEIADWGFCGENAQNVYKLTGLPNDHEMTNRRAEVSLGVGDYTVNIETICESEKKSLSSTSPPLSFSVCKKERPEIGTLSIREGQEDVELQGELEVVLSKEGRDCIHAESSHFAVVISRYDEGVTLAAAAAAVPRQIRTINSDTPTVKLPVLSPSRVYQLSVFAYTAKDQSSEGRVVRFKTRGLWCTEEHCKNGECTELTKTCACHADYSGEHCDRSAGDSILLAAVVIPVVAVAVVAVVLVAVWKRRKRFGLRMPDFSKSIFIMPKPIDSPRRTDEKTVRERLREDALSGFTWAIGVLEGADATELDNVCRAFVYGFERDKMSLSFLSKLIRYEVRNSTSTMTLFRSNSFATKSFKVYARFVGLPYLFHVLAPLLDKLIKQEQKSQAGVSLRGHTKEFEGVSTAQTDAYELNPELAADRDSAYIEMSALAIQVACQLFITTLNKTVKHCPNEFKTICELIRVEVSAKYPTANLELAMSAFLFLRFFVAGISVPESFSLVAVPPSADVRRQLVLISKVIQNISNHVRFGEKEDFMTVMNDFIDQNEFAFTNYYEKLLREPLKDKNDVVVPDKYYNAAVEVIAAADGKRNAK